MDLARVRYENFVAWMQANSLNANSVASRAGLPYTTLKTYLDKEGRASLKGDNEAKIAGAFGLSTESIFGAAEIPEDAREANFIAAWREHVGLTQEDLAAKLGTSLRIVEQLEAGELEFSTKWMRRLAPIFDTQMGFLLMDPADAQSDLVLTAATFPKAQQPQAAAVLKAMKTGTDG